MGLIKNILNQTRKPEGFWGKLLLSSMNLGHAAMADWGMERLENVQAQRLLEIGCGAGRSAGELMKRYSRARLTAIDYSPASVRKTREYNRAFVEAGRCTVEEGDVSALRFDEGSFDLVTAFETVYFWPGLEHCFGQVARVLEPGGHFLIVNESNGLDAGSQKFEKVIDGMKIYTAEQIEAALKAAGFTQVTTAQHPLKPWIAVLATK